MQLIFSLYFSDIDEPKVPVSHKRLSFKKRIALFLSKGNVPYEIFDRLSQRTVGRKKSNITPNNIPNATINIILYFLEIRHIVSKNKIVLFCI